MSDYHKLLIRTTTREEQDARDLDKANGQVVSDFIDGLEGRRPIARADLPEPNADQRARLPYVIAARQSCLLCQGEPYAVSHWKIPDSLAKGRKDSTIFFSLCLICTGLPGVLQLVTQELLSRVKGQQVKSPLLDVQ